MTRLFTKQIGNDMVEIFIITAKFSLHFQPSTSLKAQRGGLRSWNTFVFSLSLYPVGWIPHNEFIAYRPLRRFQAFFYRKMFKKLTSWPLSKEIHLSYWKLISTTSGLRYNEKDVGSNGKMLGHLRGSYESERPQHTHIHTRPNNTSGAYHQAWD